MKILLTRVNQAVHFEARNMTGKVISIDGSSRIGGENNGFRPMELLATAAASCASIDVVLILKKQRQKLEDLKVHITANRRDEIPQIFTNLNFHFEVSGDIDETKLEKAIELSLTKYCSVLKSLNESIKIQSSYTKLKKTQYLV